MNNGQFLFSFFWEYKVIYGIIVAGKVTVWSPLVIMMVFFDYRKIVMIFYYLYLSILFWYVSIKTN